MHNNDDTIKTHVRITSSYLIFYDLRINSQKNCFLSSLKKVPILVFVYVKFMTKIVYNKYQNIACKFFRQGKRKRGIMAGEGGGKWEKGLDENINV